MAFNESRHGLSITKNVVGTTYTSCLDDIRSNKTLDIIDVSFIQVAFCLVYTIIFVLGVSGNVLVCYVVFRNKAMQTVTNLFITNLALSDILLCLFAVPLTPMYTFIGEWIFGQILCHLMPYAQGCSIYISTLTLTSIAIDRFFVIIYPFHPRMKLKTCLIIIICIWLFSLLVTCPYGLFINIMKNDNKTYCEENWPTDNSGKVFGAFTAILQFLIPFLVIAICYTCVSIKLNHRAKSKPGSKNMRKEEADRERKKRTNRMLISMVTIFGISWLPLTIVNLLNDFFDNMSCWQYNFFFFFIAHSLAMASTCYNPFLYAWLNENFRKEFKQVLPCFESSAIIRSSFNSGRAQSSRPVKTCNGNDTIQESLLSGIRVNSIKQKDNGINGSKMQDSGVEMENIVLNEKTASAAYIPRPANIADPVYVSLIDQTRPVRPQDDKLISPL